MKYIYQKYIILSTPRTGSQYLVHLLHSHPNVISMSEPFQPYFHVENPGKTIFNNLLFKFLYKYLRDQFPILVIKKFIFRDYPAKIKAVGFKMFYEQAQKGRAKKVWDYLNNIQDLKIIHLKRENVLKSLVSLCIADKINQFIKYDDHPIPQIKFKLSVRECESYFKFIENSQKKYAEFFSGKKVMNLTYESLMANTAVESKKVQKFLGLSVKKLTSPLKKQNIYSLKDTIINYSKLKKYFKNTRWARYFD